MAATIFALTDADPGPVSLDDSLGIERCGAAWAIAQLAAGAAGSELISRVAQSASGFELEAAAVAARDAADASTAASA